MNESTIKTEKRCPRCGRTLPLSAFNKGVCNSDGLQNYCRECMRDYMRERYAKKKRQSRANPDYIPMYKRPIEEQREHNRQRHRRWVDVIMSTPKRRDEYIAKRRAYAARYKLKKLMLMKQD